MLGTLLKLHLHANTIHNARHRGLLPSDIPSSDALPPRRRYCAAARCSSVRGAPIVDVPPCGATTYRHVSCHVVACRVLIVFLRWNVVTHRESSESSRLWRLTMARPHGAMTIPNDSPETHLDNGQYGPECALTFARNDSEPRMVATVWLPELRCYDAQGRSQTTH